MAVEEEEEGEEEEEQCIDLPVAGQSVPPAQDHELPALRGTSPLTELVEKSPTFSRCKMPRRYNGRGKQAERKANRPRRGETLPQVYESAKITGHGNGSRRSSYASSSSGRGHSNFQRAHWPDINTPSGLKQSGTLHGEPVVSSAPSLSRERIDLSHPSNSTKSTKEKAAPQRERKRKSSAIRQRQGSNQPVWRKVLSFPLYIQGGTQESVTKKRMRLCMRRVPQAAAIVTATDINDSQNPWKGATVSSFTTVTFEPDVIISLNLKLPSATFDAIQISNYFAVHMLKPSKSGAEIASQFARGHAASPFSDAGTEASIAAWQRPKRFPATSPPVLYKGHGIYNPVAFGIRCVYLPDKTVHLGDHAVIFGIVEEVPASSYDHDEGGSKTCLAYVDGCYGRVEPLSKQSLENSAIPSIHEKRNGLRARSTRPPILKQDLIALASHAMDVAPYFRKSFLSEVNLVGLRSQTKKFVRNLRSHSSEILNTILRISVATTDFQTSSRDHSPLLLKAHQLFAFYFIFCSSRHLSRREFPHLPQSIVEYHGEFIGRKFEADSAIRSLLWHLDDTIKPDPHPLYALRKAPMTINLAFPYIESYAKFFVTDGNVVLRHRVHPHTFSTFVFPYFVRLYLMRIWLRNLRLRVEMLSLVDPLLDVPSRYLLLVRNWLVLCATKMTIPQDLLFELRNFPDTSFRKELARYNGRCISLWKDLQRMKLKSHHKTIPAMMAQWQLFPSLNRELHGDTRIAVEEGDLENATRTMIVEETMEYAELLEEEEEEHVEDLEYEDNVLDLLQDKAEEGNVAECTSPEDGTGSSSRVQPPSLAKCPPSSSEGTRSQLASRGASKRLDWPPMQTRTTSPRLEVGDKVKSTNSTQDFDENSTRAKPREQAVTSELSRVSTSTKLPWPVPVMQRRNISSVRKIFHRSRDYNESLVRFQYSEPKSLPTSSLQLPIPKNRKTIAAEHPASVPPTIPVDGGTVDASLIGRPDVGRTKGDGLTMANVHPRIRPGFVDQPPFRKVSIDRRGMQRIDSNNQQEEIYEPRSQGKGNTIRFTKSIIIRKHYLRTDRPRIGRIRKRRRKRINALIEGVLVRKHLSRNERPIVLSPRLNQSTINPHTAEQTDEIEALIEALLYGSGLRTKKHLSRYQPNKHLDVPLTLYMSNGLHELLREKVGNAIRKTPMSSENHSQDIETGSVKQHREVQKLAEAEAMCKDIEDVMGEIQNYFKTKSREEVGSGPAIDPREKLRGGESEESSTVQYQFEVEPATEDDHSESGTDPAAGEALGTLCGKLSNLQARGGEGIGLFECPKLESYPHISHMTANPGHKKKDDLTNHPTSHNEYLACPKKNGAPQGAEPQSGMGSVGWGDTSMNLSEQFTRPEWDGPP